MHLNSLVLQPNRNMCIAVLCDSGKSPRAVSDISRWKLACIFNMEEFKTCGWEMAEHWP